MIPTVVTTATVPTTSIINTMSSVTTVTPSWAAESTRFRPISTSYTSPPLTQPYYAPQPSYVQKESTRFQPTTAAFVPAPPVQPSFAPQPSYVQVKTERPPLQTHRWKISFNGQGDPANFLERIEEICVAESILPDSLLPRMPDLLQGEAAYWFRNNRMSWRTWQEFVTDFRNFYFPINYQVDLEAEISRRLHKANEPVSAYLTELQTLIRRNGSLSPDQQLSWLYRNLRPEFRQYIRRSDFHDVPSLSKIAREFELLKREVDQVRPVERPPPPANSFWKQNQVRAADSRPERRPIHVAELRQPPPNTESWRQTRSSAPESRPAPRPTVASEITRTRPTTQPAEPRPVARAPPPPSGQDRAKRLHVPFDQNVCWRCGQTGHFRSECTGKQRIFCSRCGKPDILSRNCPCQKPENY